MKNRLTLKALKAELDNLKLGDKSKSDKINGTSKTSKGIGHDIKNSYINNLHMKSGALMLYIITGILGYAHKIPFVRKIILGLSFWYGKSTWWQILVKILILCRKVIVYINAAIGVYVVFKTVGFSTDNIFAGFIALGHEYILILQNTVKRLFNWFVELFDYKIIPQVHSNPGSKPYFPNWTGPKYNTWYTKPMQDSSFIDVGKYKDLYKGPFNFNIEATPWYKDWSTLLWIAGGVITVGIGYICYQCYYDPMFLYNLTKSTPSITHTEATPPNEEIIIGPPSRGRFVNSEPSTSGLSNVTGSIGNGISTATKGFIGGIKYTMHKLNPLNWTNSAAEKEAAFDSFMYIQNEAVTANRRLYPFTTDNPYDGWFKKLKIHYFGESVSDYTTRLRDLKTANSLYESIRVKAPNVTPPTNVEALPVETSLWSHSGNSTPNPRSPIVSALGLSGLGGFNTNNFPVSKIINQVQGLPEAVTSSEAQLKALRITNIPSSPVGMSNTEVWAKNTADYFGNTPLSHSSELPNATDLGGIDPHSTIAGIEVHDNRFSILTKN